MPDSKPESSVEGGKKQNKRRLDEGESEGCAVTIASAPTFVPVDEDSSTPSPQRPRLELNKGKLDGRSGKSDYSKKDRWVSHKMTEDYVNFVGDLMYPKKKFGTFGYNLAKSKYPVSRITSLGYLLNPMRRRSVVEKWNPFEVSVFEGGMTLFGKKFHKIQKCVQTKSVKEIIEFYYFWKKTSHYKQWKKSFKPDKRELPDFVEDDEIEA